MDFVAQQRFQALRKQLDSLHYNQPFNIESTALVERLLNEVMQTTEAFQQLKNDNTVIAQEASLNSQSMAPLQKENERLVKENNSLHFQLIAAKEHADGADLKWKAQCRQSMNEVQDLRFLLTQKDSSIAKLDQENAKLRQKLDRVMEKLYMPSQDQIVGGLTSEGKLHNVIKGAQQNFELNAALNAQPMGNGEPDDLGEDQDSLQASSVHPVTGGGSQVRDQEWAKELRRADERATEIRHKYQELVQNHLAIEDKVKELTTSIEVRDNEILRLSSLYTGGQNMEKLSMKYQQDLNEKTVTKLQNQVDFLNKENHRIQTQLDFFTKDKSVTDHLEQQKREIDELSFENQTLRKDLRELTSTLKDFQEVEYRQKQLDKLRIEQGYAAQEEIMKKLEELECEKIKTQEERNNAEALRAAFNADKAALQERMKNMEHDLKEKESLNGEVERRLALTEANDSHQRNELNFWNGKVTNMRRDLDFQQEFNTKLAEENTTLKSGVDALKKHLELKDKEQNLLTRQIRGLHEDNERIANMYKMVKDMRTVDTNENEDVVAPNSAEAYAVKKKLDRRADIAKKGWQTVEDDGFGGSFGTFSPGTNVTVRQPTDGKPPAFDQKATVKRND